MKTHFKRILAAALLGACALPATADDVIKIVKPANQLTRVAVSGFSGEAESVFGL